MVFTATLADSILAWLILKILTTKLPQPLVKIETPETHSFYLGILDRSFELLAFSVPHQGWICTAFGMKNGTRLPFYRVSGQENIPRTLFYRILVKYECIMLAQQALRFNYKKCPHIISACLSSMLTLREAR
jgi:hypothetical protein